MTIKMPNMQDPTREEILTALREGFGPTNDFDREEAIYWFAADWHGGQGSNLYSVLSTSDYKPGRSMSSARLVDDAAEIYEALTEIFGIPPEDQKP